MRRFAIALLLTALAPDGISYARQVTRQKPAKKSAAGPPVAGKATRPPATPSPSKVIPARPAQRTASPVDEAGNRAAAAAASERVHAWMRDHHEVITEDADAAARAPRKPAVAAATKPATSKPGAVADNNGQTATTEDFLKAAEKRKAVEDKKQPAEKQTEPKEEFQSTIPAETTPDAPKAIERVAVVETPKPAKKAIAAAIVAPKAEKLAAAALKLDRSIAEVSFVDDEQEPEAKPVAEKPALVLAKPSAPVASTASNPVERERSRKPVIVEKAASELPAPPVLAVKRTELVDSTPSASPIVQPKLTFRRGRLVIPAPLLGSHAILVRQNIVADKYGLERIQDDGDLERLRKSHQLVALPDNSILQVDDRLAANRRYARPWAVKFLNDLAKAHNVRFHGSIQVNSAVRTVEFQQRLLRTNGNAAPADGDTASPHLTGQAVDIAKHGLSMTEIAWLRAYLLPLVQEGKIDVEEEFQQACFHISIYKNYIPEPKKESTPAKGRSSRTVLATALP